MTASENHPIFGSCLNIGGVKSTPPLNINFHFGGCLDIEEIKKGAILNVNDTIVQPVCKSLYMVAAHQCERPMEEIKKKYHS